MSKRIGRGRRQARTPRRASTPAATAATRSLQSPLARLTDTPHLARVVPHLPPETLHQIVTHYGLEACGELVALATPAQLATVFDLDLWQSGRPGHDEHFDAGRFGEWVELLVDAGDAVAARTVAAMDPQLVVAGLSRYVRVFDPATIATTLEDEPHDVVDKASHHGPECEVGGYVVRGITNDARGAIVALLLALQADHDDCFHAVMRECRRLSNSAPEIDGLDDLLMEPEQLLHDVALHREDRRSRRGYSTPAEARAFLLMARRPRRRTSEEPAANPIVAAYFRAAHDTDESGNDAGQDVSRRSSEPVATSGGLSESPAALVDMLFEAGVMPQRPRALLEAGHAEPSSLGRIRTLMAYVRDNDGALYLTRSHELAFLANTLVAGCSIQGRAFTPPEASDAAAAICNLGLEHWPALWHDSRAIPAGALDVPLPDSFLMDHDLVSAFEVGWALLHENVSMFVAGQLLVALSDLRCTDADIQRALHTLRIELTKQRDTGTPWRARDAAEVIGMLDIPAWISVMGLLDECPVLPAALTAILERRTGAISPTAFEFVATCSQLGQVREFMAQFLHIVRR